MFQVLLDKVRAIPVEGFVPETYFGPCDLFDLLNSKVEAERDLASAVLYSSAISGGKRITVEEWNAIASAPFRVVRPGCTLPAGFLNLEAC